MNKKMITEHIVNALATYICVTSIKNHKFINEVNLDPISNLLNPSFSERSKAIKRARDFLRDFT